MQKDRNRGASAAGLRLVITASALGTVFEWYDFFVYGTLAASGIIGRTFFPAGSETAQTLLAWAGFAVGFGFRPLGAAVFGHLGDRLGRKYTFLVTVAVMGGATAAVGLVPSARAIGWAAPVLVLLLRAAQGLALGGEYGGAAVYVAEHAPPGRAGFATSFIQAGVVGGFILSLAVVLAVKAALGAQAWTDWAWRAPFWFSLLLLGVSLWMRLKLSESPVFVAMREAGELSKAPLAEAFRAPGNLRRMLVALFGIAAGLTVIFYTAQFTVLSFLAGPMRMEETTAQLLVAAGVVMTLGWFVLFGWLSDRVGRKRPIVIGYAATLLLLFPIFWAMGAIANPALARAARTAPVVVAGPDCGYSPFAAVQAGRCAQVEDALSKRGVAYTKARAAETVVLIAGRRVADVNSAGLDAALAAAGWPSGKVRPSPVHLLLLFVLIAATGALAGSTFGPVAALLAEYFPPSIRYSSMSLPYHVGTGYFGGFLPLVSSYIVARTGDPYAGLWYTVAVVAMALVVTWFGLDERELASAPVAGTRRPA